jgi:hypothetical protein
VCGNVGLFRRNRGDYARVLYIFRTRGCGCNGTRHSPRPFGRKINAQLGRFMPRECGGVCCCCLRIELRRSRCRRPRKRATQYSRDASDGIEKPRCTGYPACAGYDDFSCSGTVRHMMYSSCFRRNDGRSQVNATSTLPNPDKSIITRSPALSHSVFTRLPVSTICPARNPLPSAARWLASQASALWG